MSTGIDDRPATRSRSGRRAVWLAVAVAIGWLLIGSVAGPLSGKLSEVSSNDNASFLPASAESTLAANEQAAFSEGDSLPVLVVLTRPDGAALAPDDLAAAAAFAQAIPGLPVEDATVADYLDPGPIVPIPSQDGQALLINVPLNADLAGENTPDGELALGGHHGVDPRGSHRRRRAPGQRDRPGRHPHRPDRDLRRDRHRPAGRDRADRRDHPDLRLPQPVHLGHPAARLAHGLDGRQRHRLRPRQERGARPQRPEPGHPHRARLRRRHRLRTADDRALSRGAAPPRPAHRRDQGRLARDGRAHHGERRHRHHRPDVPAAERAQLQPLTRAGRRGRHPRRAGGLAHLPPGTARHPEHRAARPRLPHPDGDRPRAQPRQRHPRRAVRRRRRAAGRRHDRRLGGVRHHAHPPPRVGAVLTREVPARPLGVLAQGAARGRRRRAPLRRVVPARHQRRPSSAQDVGRHRSRHAGVRRVLPHPQGRRHHHDRGVRQRDRLRRRSGRARAALRGRARHPDDRDRQRGCAARGGRRHPGDSRRRGRRPVHRRHARGSVRTDRGRDRRRPGAAPRHAHSGRGQRGGRGHRAARSATTCE